MQDIVAVAGVEGPTVALKGETEQDNPVGSWVTIDPRLTVPEKPCWLVMVIVAVVVDPTIVVTVVGLTAMVKS